jgi:hypothetical protein
MSVCLTFTCDECGDEVVEHLDAYCDLGGVTSLELPYGWKVDPEDDEQHLCDSCANPIEWVEPAPPMAGHPNPARALPEGDGPLSSYPSPAACSPAAYCGKCRECLRQGLWDGGDR